MVELQTLDYNFVSWSECGQKRQWVNEETEMTANEK